MPEKKCHINSSGNGLFMEFQEVQGRGNTAGWEVKTLERSGLGGTVEESLRVDAMRAKLHIRMAEENEEKKDTVKQ